MPSPDNEPTTDNTPSASADAAVEETVTTLEVLPSEDDQPPHEEPLKQDPAEEEAQAAPNNNNNNNEPMPMPQLLPANNDTIDTNHAAVLRRGKWTPEESAYANRLIVEFKRGTLPLPPNVTLREFLSRLLRCDPMRITKKFEGDNSLRKVVYRPSSNTVHDAGTMTATRGEVKALEDAFLHRITKTKSSSSQATADKALLDAFHSSGAGDLLELFGWEWNREVLQHQQQQQSDAFAAVVGAGAVMTTTYNVAAMEASPIRTPYKRHNNGIRYPININNNTTAKAVHQGSSMPSFQRDLLMHLSRMQMLIQGQSHLLTTLNDGEQDIDDDEQPPSKKFKSDNSLNTPQTSTDNDDQGYNAAVSNLLSVQRMILDNKHKLYDLEFNLVESTASVVADSTTNNNCGSNSDYSERRNQVMDSIKEEIQMLEKQKKEMERDIQIKYTRPNE
eukprot:scaffold126214_cov62-Cyclotella_meneghiniana.AAC.4